LRRRNSFLTVLLLGALLVLGACGGGSEGASGAEESSDNEVVLSYAFFAPDSTFPAIQMKQWAEELDKRTETDVKIEMFFGGSLLEAENMLDGVKNGTADIGLTATTYEPGRFPLLEISDLPSGYPNSEVASQVVYQLVEEFEHEALEDFKIVTAFATEPSFIQSREKISNLEELKGKQLRISGGLTPVMEKLGASPVGMSQAEVPEAVQTGVIDGNISSREVVKDFKLAENLHYVTDFPLTVTSFVAVMTKETWESLPEDVQVAIDELAPEMSQFTGAYLDKYVEEALEWAVEEHGLEIVPLEDGQADEWTKLISDIQDEAVEQANEKELPGSEYKERLYELVEEFK